MAHSDDNVLFISGVRRTYRVKGAYSASSARCELSWPVNSHWPHIKANFMSQSNSVPVNEAARNSNTGPAKNIVETTIATGNFSTFAAGIKSAGLTDALSAKGPFTVFAPTDEAFAKLPPGAWDGLLKDSAKLKAVLNYHVVPGHFVARELKAGEVMTLQGSTLTAALAFGDVSINGARITRRDVIATNGIIHAIDTVILPKNWQLSRLAA